MPLISVVIPVFNRLEPLERALASIENQTFKDYEVIVVDDHSTLDISSVTKKFETKLLKSNGRGVSAARNTGIQTSTSEFVAFLDSDDEWVSKKLELQMKYFSENQNCAILHTNETWIRNGKPVHQGIKQQKSGGRIFSKCTEACLIAPSSVLVKRSLLNETGLFDEDFPVCEDFDLWLRITATENIGFLSEPLVIKHGGHDDQLSRQFHSMDLWRVRALAKQLENLNLTQDERMALVTSLRKKSEILMKGFQKHQNFEHVYEIEHILEKLKIVLF